MRRLDLSNGSLFSLTDAMPDSAVWSYAFPHAQVIDYPQVASRWLPDMHFHTRFSVFAFERDGEVVVIDAGIGNGPSQYFNGMRGRLPAELAAAGLDREVVTHVLLTHFHLDHVGWATDASGDAFFPNARYHAPEAELLHWRDSGAQAALPHHVEAFERHLAPLIAKGRLEAEKAGETIVRMGTTDVSYRAVPGHTPGHCGVVIGGDETVLVAGDAWHSPAQIAVPAWCHRADRDPVQATRSRTALGEWAHNSQVIVAAGHFPESAAFGRIGGSGIGMRTFLPIDDARR